MNASAKCCTKFLQLILMPSGDTESALHTRSSFGRVGSTIQRASMISAKPSVNGAQVGDADTAAVAVEVAVAVAVKFAVAVAVEVAVEVAVDVAVGEGVGVGIVPVI